MPSETPKQRRDRLRREKAEARAEEKFSNAHKASTSFGAKLRKLSEHVADIIKAHAPAPGEAFTPGQLARIDQALRLYSQAITPWARAASARMITEVDRRNITAWEKYTRGMAAALRKELRSPASFVGGMMESLLANQVQLITSLPLEAAQRVHEKTLEAQFHASRYPEQEAEIREKLKAAHPEETYRWLRARATLIARTETARTASVLTEARSRAIGVDQYIWKTAGDARVRKTHRALNGSAHSWDDPPPSDQAADGSWYHSHPGQIWNCRCVALPIVMEQ
jgi:SPP1 gp7 family putative phage head morphogenesis protein